MNGFGKGKQRLLILYILMISLVFTFAAYSESRATAPKKVAIIIDDLGNHMRGTEEMLQMPFPITLAVMPFMETTRADAEKAHAYGKDVIIHLPMEPVKGKKSWLGPNPITHDLSDDEIRRRVYLAIDDVPYAVGMNNHMGSKILGDKRIMQIVLEICKERGLFFIDSKTGSDSVVATLTGQLEMAFIRNEMFFDDVNSQGYIEKQIRKMEKYLQTHDHCIAIGHVGVTGKNMAFVLKKMIPTLQKNIEFVSISEYVNTYYDYHKNDLHL